MLAANQAVLLQRFPTVLERILAVGNRPPNSFYYETKDGVATLMIQRGGIHIVHTVHLISTT